MARLTRDLLSIYNLRTVRWQIVKRGKAYHAQGRVTIAEFTGDSATCIVRGSHGQRYTVVLRAEGKNRLATSCTCPYAAREGVCKHVVAATMAVRQYVVEVVENRWDFKLEQILEAPFPKRRRASDYVLVYSLRKDHLGRFRFVPLFVALSRWWQAPRERLDMEAFNRYLAEDLSWQQVARLVEKGLDPYACRNLPPDAVQTCNLMVSAARYYDYYYRVEGISIDRAAAFFPILAYQNVPVFLTKRKKVRCLRWHPQPVQVVGVLLRSQEGLSLDLGVSIGETKASFLKGNLVVLSADPAWVLAGDFLAPVANPEILKLPADLPIVVPPEEEETFRSRYFPRLAERLPLRGGIISVEDVEVEPVPRLYLQEVGGDLRATLAFGYGEYEVEADPRAKPVKMIGRPESWSLIYLHRRLDRERYYYQLLTDPRYGLKRAGRGFGPAVFRLRARTHPLDFLMDCIPHLTEAGFEVYGEEKLRSVRLRRVSPTLRVAVSSGIDWFDIQAVVAYGDQTVPLREVLRAVRKGRRFVKLADGSFGRIPEEWLERYRHLFAFAENTEEGFRVRHVHLSLLDELLDDAAEVEAPPDLEERRQRLRSFDRITPQPVPKGFRGELRPYQKAGLDWLHFLHDYGFGGILADDMGLGKTIQVLAFLQSLKERGEAEHASLLVVPKSLLTNWQREAARFTPALRVLPFVGKDRKKDTAFFDQYDIVLTTYGTMLRDIQFLRSYRFHYAILDESQAIKNPLAKTAQAARRLNADHRLAVTGTPVENTTFELWSQFAFVLPGLLGGLEFFRKEFAIPIERGGDKGAAARLRRLVFPFILRRTKDQVAPELPPRTERLLFADLTPAQRSLYSRYRDRYRAEVLGLIDRQGINSARMKILEGLLRLRQICLHPALVEPTFRGKAGKFDVLFEVLETLLAERHKVLIYSQFVKVLHLVRERLDQSGAPYAYLDGRTRDRHAQVDRFQNDPDVPFFLISLRAGGLGLNLTAADYVILLDPWWNPAVEAQAADRVHRIGQDKPVFVYKLIAKDTVEEKILELQERKRKLVADLITTERGFAKSLTREDVEVLFG